jgi:hypothetical protein
VGEPWSLKGELMLSCNCTVFCPCVLSLGLHPPTEGYCMTWAGIRIDSGYFGDTDLSGLKAGLMIEIPGLMSRGNWTAGAFIDDASNVYQEKALTRILSGKAEGTTGLLKILVGKFLGVTRTPMTYETNGATRAFQIPGIIDGAITPVRGKEKGADVTIENSEYWIAPKITVCKADKSRLRAFGRNWNFAGRSAELCELDWGNV